MTKRKQNKIKKMQKQKWKKILRRYPFLAIRSMWTGEVCQDGEPWLSDDGAGGLPIGWVKRFGFELCEELRDELLKYNALDKMYIEEVKEKFGEMRLYAGNVPYRSDIDKIIEKYSFISYYTCTGCGEMGVSTIDIGGWVIPMCEHCYNKLDKKGIYINKIYDEAICNRIEKMPETYNLKIYQKGKTIDVSYDISDTVKKIQYRKPEPIDKKMKKYLKQK